MVRHGRRRHFRYSGCPRHQRLPIWCNSRRSTQHADVSTTTSCCPETMRWKTDRTHVQHVSHQRESCTVQNPLPTRNPNQIGFHVVKINSYLCWQNGISPFQIRRLEGDREAVFSVHPCDGVIPPEDEVVVTATYSPVSAGTFSRDHYEVVTVGGNKV